MQSASLVTEDMAVVTWGPERQSMGWRNCKNVGGSQETGEMLAGILAAAPHPAEDLPVSRPLYSFFSTKLILILFFLLLQALMQAFSLQDLGSDSERGEE